MSEQRCQGTVAIVGGAGAVGSTTAFALTDSRLVDEIVLVDIDDERAVGEAMDLGHGTASQPRRGFERAATRTAGTPTW